MTANESMVRARAFALIKSKSFIRGDVTLASGKTSNHYFDMKPAMFDPEGAYLLADLILDRLKDISVDYVGGLEMGAVPLIGCIAMRSFEKGSRPIPGLFVRKAIKGHGTQKRIEGAENLRGKHVAVLEDVTTTGQSAMAAVTALRAAGAEISLVLSIVDRQEGASAFYDAAGIPFQSLFEAGEFLKS